MDHTKSKKAALLRSAVLVPKRQLLPKLLQLLVYLAAVVIFTLIMWLVGYIVLEGVQNFQGSLFDPTYTSENVSLLPALINTFSFVLLTLAAACPVGIFAAVYFVEYADNQRIWVKILRLATETLAGVPSIVFGLFGYLCFVVTFKMSYSQLAGCLTLAVMVLPVIIRTTEEALLAVSPSLKEGSFALGAGKVRTIFHLLLPSALPGITGGIILSVGRIVGETAALIYTAGTVAQIAEPLSSGRTLAVHMYALLSEGLYLPQASATALVLLVLVVLLNLSTALVTKFLQKETF